MVVRGELVVVGSKSLASLMPTAEHDVDPVRCACNRRAKGMHEIAFCDRPHFFFVIRSAAVCQYS
jgi:hypothetical protein